MISLARLLLPLLIVHCANISICAEGVRTFTDQKGRPLQATLIDATESTVTVERSPDGARFDIPIASLSTADQEWIASWKKANRPEPEPLGDNWFRVTIDLPGPDNRVEVLGFEREYATRISGTAFEMILPLGAWIKPDLQGPDGTLFSLIEYRGERKLTIRKDGRTMLVSRDGKAPLIAGVTLPLDESKIVGALNELSRNRFDDGFCLSTWEISTHLDEILKSKIPVGSIYIYEGIGPGDAAKIAAMSPRAVSVGIYGSELSEVAAFGNVETVDLRVPRKFDFAQGFPKEDSQLDFPVLPAVTQLSVWGDMASVNYDQFLAAKPLLRLLKVSATIRGQPAPLTGIGGIESLTMLNAGSGVQIDPADLTGLPRLRHLTASPHTFSRTATNAAEIAKLDKLLYLDIRSANLPEEVIESWVESGNLAGLRGLEIRHPVDLTKLPNLETLALKSHQALDQHRLENLKDLAHLRSLYLESIRQKDLEELSTFPFFGRLQSLSMGKVNLDNLAPLAAARNLRVLSVGTESGIQTIDLGVIPAIEHVRLAKLSSLTEIGGISAHRNLARLSVSYSHQLKTLGEPGPNTTLRSLSIYQCNGLASLEALSGLTGLKSLSLQECGVLSEPMKLDELNDLEVLMIRDCPKLDRRAPGL